MRTPFDRLAKWILVPVLGRLGTVITEAEIVDVGLRADLAFRPALEPLRGDVRESERIGRMADRQALWEYFYDKAVSPADLERCLKKQRYWTDGSDRRVVARTRVELGK